MKITLTNNEWYNRGMKNLERQRALYQKALLDFDNRLKPKKEK